MARPAVLAIIAAVVLGLNANALPFEFLTDSSQRGDRPRCDTESFSRLLPAEAALEKVAVVPEGGSYGEGPANIAYPRNPTNLPALCAVTVRVMSSPTSSYRFGLFLPEEWNGKFLVVGNGGFAGGINWMDMAAGPRYGMASLSTDTGHNSTATDGSWALNQPEKKTDWGWRAIHGSTVLGKRLVRAYYGEKRLTYSYFSGCSTGGRQGLKELQEFPDSFDGALIGAPAWWTSHLNPYILRVGLLNLPVTDPRHVTNDQVLLVADEVVRQCDPLDGVRDGIISRPELCHPDLSTLLCRGSDTSKCLTPAQIVTIRNVYAPWLSSSNPPRLLHPGFTQGSEKQWYLVLNGSHPSPYGLDYVRYFLLDDPTWDWRNFNELVVYLADARDPGDATADDYAALAAVRGRGGKVIMYHGEADGLVPTKGTELYYNRTVAALHSDGVADFFRMFLVPGMQHCFNTAANAPWFFAGAFQGSLLGNDTFSVPGFEDAKHDALMALMQWVERGRAVESIVATTWNQPLNASSGVKRQRPICAWLRKAVWDGRGDVDAAESWSCSG